MGSEKHHNALDFSALRWVRGVADRTLLPTRVWEHTLKPAISGHIESAVPKIAKDGERYVACDIVGAAFAHTAQGLSPDPIAVEMPYMDQTHRKDMATMIHAQLVASCRHNINTTCTNALHTFQASVTQDFHDALRQGLDGLSQTDSASFVACALWHVCTMASTRETLNKALRPIRERLLPLPAALRRRYWLHVLQVDSASSIEDAVATTMKKMGSTSGRDTPVAGLVTRTCVSLCSAMERQHGDACRTHQLLGRSVLVLSAAYFLRPNKFDSRCAMFLMAVIATFEATPEPVLGCVLLQTLLYVPNMDQAVRLGEQVVQWLQQELAPLLAHLKKTLSQGNAAGAGCHTHTLLEMTGEWKANTE